MKTIEINQFEREDIKNIVREVLIELLQINTNNIPQPIEQKNVIDFNKTNLSNRSTNILRRLGARCLNDVKFLSEKKLRHTKGCGETVIRDIKYECKQFGITLLQ